MPRPPADMGRPNTRSGVRRPRVDVALVMVCGGRELMSELTAPLVIAWVVLVLVGGGRELMSRSLVDMSAHRDFVAGAS